MRRNYDEEAYAIAIFPLGHCVCLVAYGTQEGKTQKPVRRHFLSADFEDIFTFEPVLLLPRVTHA
jgi:hypothetical protein